MKEIEFDINDFDLGEENQIATNVEIKPGHYKHQAKKEMELIKREKAFEEFVPEMSTDHDHMIISSDNFGSIELLSYMIRRFPPEKVTIITWSYNSTFVDLIEQILKAGSEVEIIVDVSIKTRKNSLYAKLAELLETFDKFVIKTHYMVHAKMTLIKSGNHHIIITGSANYSNNQRVEQFEIKFNKGMYEFNQDWIKQIIRS